MITAKRLREILRYDPETGWFVWIAKTSRKVVIGRRAGSVNAAGYRVIGIDGRLYYAHRLAWLYMTGEWPALDIDHRFGDNDDNSWDCLREATEQQNALNSRRYAHNSSGFKGVSWHRAAAKWSAQIVLSGCQKHLGLFDTPEAAHAAYFAAAKAAHPEFARAS